MNSFQSIKSGKGILKDNYDGGIKNQIKNISDAITRKRDRFSWSDKSNMSNKGAGLFESSK